MQPILVERWLYPEAHEYLGWFPAFLEGFGGRAFDAQTVWKLGDYSAVALWLPPGAEADGESIVAVLAESVAPAKHADVFSVLGQMDEAHPTFSHWYLPWFGVDPALQGVGLGGELMEGNVLPGSSIRITCPSISKPRTRGAFRFTSARASKSRAGRKPGACAASAFMRSGRPR